MFRIAPWEPLKQVSRDTRTCPPTARRLVCQQWHSKRCPSSRRGDGRPQKTPLRFDDPLQNGTALKDRYFSDDVRELDDAKADDGLARPPSQGGATENLPTAHERANSGILLRMTRDEDANSRAWFHPVQRAPVSSQTRTVKLVT